MVRLVNAACLAIMNVFSRSQTEANDQLRERFLILSIAIPFCRYIIISNLRKHEQLTRSLRKMERTLDTVLRSINNPGLASITSGMVSRSPSQSPTSAHVIPDASPGLQYPSLTPSVKLINSPRLNSLPDNSLNPLGLLAEASLANRRAQASIEVQEDGAASSQGGPSATPKIGVANDTYFKPGPSVISVFTMIPFTSAAEN